MKDRRLSVMDMSLTEVAFIFFFLLLLMSTWKIGVTSMQLASSDEKSNAQSAVINDLEAQLSSLKERLRGVEQLKKTMSSRQEDTFQELVKLQNQNRQLSGEIEALQEHVDRFSELLSVESPEAAYNRLQDWQQQLQEMKAITGQIDSYQQREAGLLSENQALKARVGQFNDLVGGDKDAFENLAALVREHQSVVALLSSQYTGQPESTAGIVQALLQRQSDLRGQNINLRDRVARLGNGLDHPPCWADPETGKIQYVFEAVIEENRVRILPAWPASREKQARGNPNISGVPGVYSSVQDLWHKSAGLYAESLQQSCRHFVRVQDHARSKAAFKKYLGGIENHFYKYLVN
jgi:hypothetical protein